MQIMYKIPVAVAYKEVALKNRPSNHDLVIRSDAPIKKTSTRESEIWGNFSNFHSVIRDLRTRGANHSKIFVQDFFDFFNFSSIFP